jgi:hypothetical protein
MTTDYRALCAELLSQAFELIDTRARDVETIIRHQELFDRAREALAQPEPVGPPAPDGGLVEMVGAAIFHQFEINGGNEAEARAAILAVADWVALQSPYSGCLVARWLREEVERD